MANFPLHLLNYPEPITRYFHTTIIPQKGKTPSHTTFSLVFFFFWGGGVWGVGSSVGDYFLGCILFIEYVELIDIYLSVSINLYFVC